MILTASIESPSGQAFVSGGDVSSSSQAKAQMPDDTITRVSPLDRPPRPLPLLLLPFFSLSLCMLLANRSIPPA